MTRRTRPCQRAAISPRRSKLPMTVMAEVANLSSCRHLVDSTKETNDTRNTGLIKEHVVFKILRSRRPWCRRRMLLYVVEGSAEKEEQLGVGRTGRTFIVARTGLIQHTDLVSSRCLGMTYPGVCYRIFPQQEYGSNDGWTSTFAHSLRLMTPAPCQRRKQSFK